MHYLTIQASKDVFKTIFMLKTEDEIKRFLGDLLTPAEIKEFGNRWQVAQMLDKKIEYKKIEKKTGMSSTTIARISKWVSGQLGGLKGYRLVLNTMKNINNKSEKQVITLPLRRRDLTCLLLNHPPRAGFLVIKRI